MLFKELEGKEIIDRHGERVGFLHDVVFTTKGRITHLIAMPKGVLTKMKMGQLNIQFEDVGAIEDVIMLNKSEDEILGRTSATAPAAKEPEREEAQAPAKPRRVLLKRKSE
ncbi:MAG: PRC-barrel domain-containing protein [Candidatus Diapherotrites archaeon]|nr:PRC-barrel domain-containing protein [Candidatus Diapherotrites archaeon]